MPGHGGLDARAQSAFSRLRRQLLLVSIGRQAVPIMTRPGMQAKLARRGAAGAVAAACCCGDLLGRSRLAQQATGRGLDHEHFTPPTASLAAAAIVDNRCIFTVVVEFVSRYLYHRACICKSLSLYSDTVSAYHRERLSSSSDTVTGITTYLLGGKQAGYKPAEYRRGFRGETADHAPPPRVE